MKRFTNEQIERVKALAEMNYIDSSEIGNENMTGFEFNGIKIINPWIDETGRFDLNDEQAIKTYGLENVLNFIMNMLEEGM